MIRFEQIEMPAASLGKDKSWQGESAAGYEPKTLRCI